MADTDKPRVKVKRPSTAKSASTTPAKKAAAAVARKTAAKKTSTPAPKAPAGRKAAGKTEVKPTGESTRASGRGGFHRDVNCLGFVPGTDSDIIARSLIEGGRDRKEINDRSTTAIEQANGVTTRTGEKKNVPSLTSAILSRLIAQGYVVEASWKLVPPENIRKALAAERAAATRKAKRTTK